MEDIEHYDIPIYNFPYDVEEDDEETIIDNSELRVKQQSILGQIDTDSLPGRPSFRNYWLGGRS